MKYQEEENGLSHITPIDGRYRTKLKSLQEYFSEKALIRYRIMVEVEYLMFFVKKVELHTFTPKQVRELQSLYIEFDLNDAQEVKKIEAITNHDVKSVEYYLQNRLRKMNLKKLIPYLHFGITSEDTNNLSYGLILRDFHKSVIVPEFTSLLDMLKKVSREYAGAPMMGRTHGQPAVPTTFGKEISIYHHRLTEWNNILGTCTFEGKVLGAIGNLNAHKYTYPHVNWLASTKQFVADLGLKPQPYATQILPLDSYIRYFQTLDSINSVLIGLCRDMRTYIMFEEVKQKAHGDEIGSSTMPQKVNPIDFENAEGNAEIANAYFQLYERKLLISRLQRDLSDSVIKRTFGTALAHTVLVWKSVVRGMNKIAFNPEVAEKHMMEHYEILAEALQMNLRKRNNEKGYEQIKELTRGKRITKDVFEHIVSKLGLDDMKKLDPKEYRGYVESLAKDRH